MHYWVAPGELNSEFITKTKMTSTPTLQKEMLQYFTQLNKKEQQSLLKFVKTLINRREEMRPQTLEEYNDELEQAATSIEAGHFITHSEVKKRILK